MRCLENERFSDINGGSVWTSESKFRPIAARQPYSGAAVQLPGSGHWSLAERTGPVKFSLPSRYHGAVFPTVFAVASACADSAHRPSEAFPFHQFSLAKMGKKSEVAKMRTQH